MSGTDRAAAPDADRRQPLSWYVFVLAILLLAVTALANVVVDLQLANRLGAYAFNAFLVGVFLRLAEYVSLPERVGGTLGRVRARLGGSMPRMPVEEGTEERATSARRALDPLLPDRDARARIAADLGAGIRLSIPITLVGGGVVVAWWWLFDPARTVSAGFLVGWVLAVFAQILLSLRLSRNGAGAP